MTEKELKRLNRSELLELLVIQTKEVERLNDKLREAEEKLADRHIRISNAGSLAHAVLEVNGIMEAAQTAADQYLENIAAMEAEARDRCERLIHAALHEAKKIREAAQRGEEYHFDASDYVAEKERAQDAQQVIINEA